jgi:hypothetical protein
MNNGSRRYHAHRYAKKWSYNFADKQSLVNPDLCDFWIDQRPALDSDDEDDELGYLVEDSEEAGPSWPVEQLRKYCHGTWLENFVSEVRSKGQRRAAWLDNRSSQRQTGHVRAYQNPLSAAELYRHLRAPVQNDESTA